MSEQLQRDFGARVKELRVRSGLTQRQLATRCGGGLVLQRIGEIERGEANSTLKSIAALCTGLRCKPVDLFLFRLDRSDAAPQLHNRRLADLWKAADDRTKAKILRVIEELVR